LSKLRVELTDNGRLEVDENGTGNVLSGTSLAEECRERVVASALHLVRRHVAVGHDAVLHAVEFPASISDLDTGLANVDRNDFPLKKKRRKPNLKSRLDLQRNSENGSRHDCSRKKEKKKQTNVRTMITAKN
jgi:hypothetical protein